MDIIVYASIVLFYYLCTYSALICGDNEHWARIKFTQIRIAFERYSVSTVKLNLGLKDRAATWQTHTVRVFWQLGKRQEMLEKKRKATWWVCGVVYVNEKKTCLGAMIRQMTKKSHEFCLVFSFVNFFFLRFFLNVGHFLKSLLNFCYNIASVLCFGFLATSHMGS